VTAAPYDGWTENLFAPGQRAVSDYPMDQRAALLWYHDHAIGVTRLTVYAGLAGLWIVRDQRERELGLPEGPPFEVPMLLQDRNFGQAADGRLTGELVHKTDPGTSASLQRYLATELRRLAERPTLGDVLDRIADRTGGRVGLEQAVHDLGVERARR
jgi:FtsP/CotA-like multicopper oxidase with cupredoxin domain